MPIRHIAYTFDFMQAHQKLYDLIVDAEIIQLTKFQNIAFEISENRSEELVTILTNFHYTENWLKIINENDTDSVDWYIIYMATFFQEAPSLSNNRTGFSDAILQKILPLNHWTDDEITELLLGRMVEELMIKRGFLMLSDNLNLESNCLGLDDLNRIKAKLVATRNQFTLDEKTKSAIIEIVSNPKRDMDKLVRNAFEDAIDMLNATEKHGDTLYLHFDW